MSSQRRRGTEAVENRFQDTSVAAKWGLEISPGRLTVERPTNPKRMK